MDSKFTEFVLWWLSQDENGILLIPYIAISVGVTVGLGLSFGWFAAIFSIIIFGSFPLYLIGYMLTKYFSKTYAEWSAKQANRK